MINLSNKQYRDLCLISYFDVKNIKKDLTIKEMVNDILSDEEFLDEASKSYYHTRMVMDLIKVDLAQFEDFIIVNYMNDNKHSGVVAYLIKYKNNYIILFRGSEINVENDTNRWQDWIDNFNMLYEEATLQQLKALDFVNKLYIENESIYLVGHSKGGHLAMYTALTCNELIYNKIRKVFTINAPGLSKQVISNYRQRYKDKIVKSCICIENKNDLVSSIFRNERLALITKSVYDNKRMIDVFDNHQLYSVCMNDNDFDFSYEGKKSALPNLFDMYINDIFMNLPISIREKQVEIASNYLVANLDINDIYDLVLGKFSKTMGLFEGLSIEEFKNLEIDLVINEFKSYFERNTVLIKTRNFVFKGKEKIEQFSIKDVVSNLIEAYELLMKERRNEYKKTIQDNLRKISSFITYKS